MYNFNAQRCYEPTEGKEIFGAFWFQWRHGKQPFLKFEHTEQAEKERKGGSGIRGENAFDLEPGNDSRISSRNTESWRSLDGAQMAVLPLSP